MPNYIKALILVLVATSVVLYFIRDPLYSHFSRQEYKTYRNTWWFLTACLFLSPDIWVFYALVLIMLLMKRYATDTDRVCAFLFLLFTAPSIEASIAGFAGINRFFELDLHRLLVLVVLTPILGKSLRGGISVNPPDKYVVLFIGLAAVHFFRGDDATNALRQASMLILEILIPYFVVSRTVKSVQDFNRVLLATAFALSMLAAEAVMEALRHWELYNATGHRLIGERVFRFSGERAGILRARAIFLSPIILGFAMILLLALWLYLKPLFNRKLGFYVLTGITLLALLVTFSRAAWVGAAVLLVGYWFLANNLGRAAVYIGSGSLLTGMFLTMTQFGQSILNLIPFLGGTARADTMNYRIRLLENGISVVKRNPWLGDHYYLEYPEMLAMRQGQGIIDTVNVYLAVAMRHGLVGLFLYLMVFVPSLFVIYRRIKTLPATEERFAALGRVLLCYMAASMLVASTLSRVGFVTTISFLAAAFLAAWINVARGLEVEKQASRATAAPARSQPPTRTHG